MSWKVSFNIYGHNFSPSKIKVKFCSQNEVGDLIEEGRNKGEQYKYGSAEYSVPSYIKREFTFKHLVDVFEPILIDLVEAGADQWHIEIGRLYFAQCNEELSLDEISCIAKLKCGISYSAYSVSEKEEENGW